MKYLTCRIVGALGVCMLSGCASLPRTVVMGESPAYTRDQFAVLLVSKGNEVTSVNKTPVSVIGKSREDEIALPAGKYEVIANQTGRPIRADTVTFDAAAGHLYRLVDDELPVQNLTITMNGVPMNLGNGSFYSVKVMEVTNAMQVQARFAPGFTSSVTRVKMADK